MIGVPASIAAAVAVVGALWILGSGLKTAEANAFKPAFVVKDSHTGCEYVHLAGGGGLTPRIDRDGKTHRGCGV